MGQPTTFKKREKITLEKRRNERKKLLRKVGGVIGTDFRRAGLGKGIVGKEAGHCGTGRLIFDDSAGKGPGQIRRTRTTSPNGRRGMSHFDRFAGGGDDRTQEGATNDGYRNM